MTALPPFPGSPEEQRIVLDELYGPGVVGLRMVTWYDTRWSPDLQTPTTTKGRIDYQIGRHSITQEAYEWALLWLAHPTLLTTPNRSW